MTELQELLQDRMTRRAFAFLTGFTAIGFLFAVAWMQ